MTEISDRFPLAEVDHQELIEIFTLRYGTCWRVAERQIAFPAHRDHQLRLELRHGQIIRIWAGNSLSDQELDGLLDQIEADLKDKRIAEFGAEILFAMLPCRNNGRRSRARAQLLAIFFSPIGCVMIQSLPARAGRLYAPSFSGSCPSHPAASKHQALS
jgi:hypothetical protein